MIVEKVERMRQLFMKERFETDKGMVEGAFSYGVEQYTDSITSLKQLIKSADEKMYQYKERYKRTLL